MLSFFRKHAEKIIIITLVAFVLTMGILGVGSSSRTKYLRNKKQTQQVKLQGTLAALNNQEINARDFLRLYNAGLAKYKTPDQKDPLDPKIDAFIRYNALSQALDFEKYLLYAKKLHVRVSNREVDYQIQAILNSYKLKSKSEFKDLLTRNGYRYNDFLKDIRNELIVNKLITRTKQTISVTDQDLKNQFKKVRARHILVAFPTEDGSAEPTSPQEKIKQTRAKVAQIYDQLMKGGDFAKLAAEYSDDKASAVKGGELGYFGPGMMTPAFEAVAFALDKGQISKPFETPYGFHIVQVEDIKQGDIPLDVDESELKKKLLETKQENAVQELRQAIGSEIEEQIFLPDLKAYDYKIRGELDKALGEYLQISAQAPQSPTPYLFIADIYEAQNKYPEALAEYNKALLIEKINPGVKTPFTHFYLGKLYAKLKNNAAAAKEYDLAEAIVKDDQPFLERLQAAYKDLGYTQRASRVALKIKALENARKLATEKPEDLNFEEKTVSHNK